MATAYRQLLNIEGVL